MGDRTNTRGEPAMVIVDRAPRVYALHADDQVVSWVFALPGGQAVVVDTAGTPMARTSLDRIQARYARYGGPRLVLVAEYEVGLDVIEARAA